MVASDVVVQSELRVEEVEVVVDNDLSVLICSIPVAWVLHFIANMAILQVDEAIQTRHKVVVDFAINVPVSLLGVVAIILEIRLKIIALWKVLHPLYESEVVAIVLVPTTSKYSLYVCMIVIYDRSHKSIEIVVHLLLANQIALLKKIIPLKPSFWCWQIVSKRTSGLILLVVALALGIVACHIKIQHTRQMLIPYQLIVLLMVVISLTIVIVAVSLLVPVLTTRVIGTSIETLFVLRGVVPGVISLLLSVPGNELYDGIVAKVSALKEVGVKFGRGAIQITF